METPLTALQIELKRRGYRIAEAKEDSLLVHLPLLARVSIRHNDKNFQFEPRFGRIKRSTATWTMFGVTLATMVAILIVPAFLKLSPTEKHIFPGVQLFVVASLICGHIWDLMRYVVTEHFITRVERLLPEGEGFA